MIEAKYADLKQRAANAKVKSLTEQEWLETCAFFGGCSICDNEHIETRHYFLAFSHGGVYTKWNMIPLCGQCSVTIRTNRRVANPYSWLNYSRVSKERQERIFEWVDTHLKEATDANNT